jgi:phosphoribosylformylglycinamidine cyclo-ligase
MPGMYPEGEYDLAGFAVGIVEKDEIITGKTIAAGDVVLGLASSGPHSNGFSLIRKVVEVSGADWNMPFDGATLADRAMEPTRIYVKQVLNVMKKVTIKGMAHITGGGLVENIPRVLPENTQCVVDGSSWKRPAIFDWLQEKGNIDPHEMHRVFNNGIGMAVVVSAEEAQAAKAAFEAEGEKVYTIGRIVERPEGAPGCVVI